MARYHLLLFMVGVSGLMTAINLMEAKPVPARRSSSSLAGLPHSLFGSMDDVSAVPTMMMMPSFVYYQMMAPFHSPFHRMIKSAPWSALSESSEEEEDDEQEDEMEEPEEGGSNFGKKETKKLIADGSQKVSQTESKKGEDKSETNRPLKDAKEAKQVEPENEKRNGVADVVNKEEQSTEQPSKECPKETKSKVSSKMDQKESPKEEESQRKSEEVASESEKERELEAEVENEEEESVTEKEELEFLTTESPTTESPSQESTLALIAETTTQSQRESIIERMPDAPKVTESGPTKTSARSSITYVCKHGKCQHNAEAKKLLEQEIEAELWAKLK